MRQGLASGLLSLAESVRRAIGHGTPNSARYGRAGLVVLAGISLLPTVMAAEVTAAPTTRPASVQASAPMPSQFEPLLKRSIFVKGYPPSPPPPPSSRPALQPVEATLVFNGATRVESQRTAFIENRSTGQVIIGRVNDPIADGKIVGISLDALEYEAHGRVIRIAIGDNFQGTPASEPTTQPSTTSTSTAASPEMQSVLERLRQRRMKELHKE